MNNQNTINAISPEALQVLGGGKLAYVKTIRSEDVQKHFPQAPELAPGSVLYALHAADATPIMLTDSREAAIKARGADSRPSACIRPMHRPEINPASGIFRLFQRHGSGWCQPDLD
jgi:hypothetical protein